MDNFPVVQELFCHYRYEQVEPGGGEIKRLLLLSLMDHKKSYDSAPSRLLFMKLYKIGQTKNVRGKQRPVYQQ